MASIVNVYTNNNFRGTGFVCHVAGGVCLVMTATACISSGAHVQHSVALPNQHVETIPAELLERCNRSCIALLRFHHGAHACAALDFAEPTVQTMAAVREVQVRGFYNLRRHQIIQEPGVFLGSVMGGGGRSGEVGSDFLRCDYTSPPGLIGAPVFMANGPVIGVHCKREGKISICTTVISMLSRLRLWLKKANQHPGPNEGIPELLARFIGPAPAPDADDDQIAAEIDDE